jgi:PIN domain nuclease of toxin-antitoxin system
MAMTMLLLDSHVTLWVMDDNPRLGQRARTRIAAEDRVHVSAATVWELTIKAMLGKIKIPDRLSECIEAQGLTLLNITPQDAEGISAYPELVRHDPFDRLLVAQAERRGMEMLTADGVLLDLNRPFVLDARV